MTAVGIGLTVAVLVTSVAMTTGMNAVFAGTGHPLQVIVLRKGTDAELNSTREAKSRIRSSASCPGIAQTPAGEPMASPEAQTVVNLPSVENPNGMNVTVRGMLPIGHEDARERQAQAGAMERAGQARGRRRRRDRQRATRRAGRADAEVRARHVGGRRRVRRRRLRPPTPRSGPT